MNWLIAIGDQLCRSNAERGEPYGGLSPAHDHDCVPVAFLDGRTHAHRGRLPRQTWRGPAKISLIRPPNRVTTGSSAGRLFR